MMKLSDVVSLLRVDEFLRMSIHMSRRLLVDLALTDKATTKAVRRALGGLAADNLWHEVFTRFIAGWEYAEAWTPPAGLVEPVAPKRLDINAKRRRYMQREMEFEVFHQERPNGRAYHNFSSAGAGKTFGALAVGLRGAELYGGITIHVICNVSQVEWAWKSEISRRTTAKWVPVLDAAGNEIGGEFVDPTGLIDVQLPYSKRPWKPEAKARIRIDHYDALSASGERTTSESATQRIERWTKDPGVKLLVLDEGQNVGAAGFQTSFAAPRATSRRGSRRQARFEPPPEDQGIRQDGAGQRRRGACADGNAGEDNTG